LFPDYKIVGITATYYYGDSYRMEATIINEKLHKQIHMQNYLCELEKNGCTKELVSTNKNEDPVYVYN
jgi:hypothetical protein